MAVRRVTRLDLTLLPETLRVEAPPQEGWQPLLHSKTYRQGGRSMITGDCGGHFRELEFVADQNFDKDGPILVRIGAETPGLTEVAVLRGAFDPNAG
jgi:hypothetical protein